MIHIELFSLIHHSYVLRQPFKIGDILLNKRESLVVELLGRSGHTGSGEAAPLPGVSVESLGTVLHQLTFLQREWQGRSLPEDPLALCSRLKKDLDASLLAPAVIFALESAVLSLAASEQNISIAEYLGGSATNVESACLIQGDLETVKASAIQYCKSGYSIFKLKVGNRNIPLDVNKVEALRETIGNNARIRLDANASWSLDEAVSFAEAVGKMNIEFIEEPCKNENDYELFFRRTDIHFAVETHSTVRSIEDWEGIQGLKAFVVKPMISGGITGFLLLQKTVKPFGIPIVISSSFESGVGLRMLANLASLTDTPCGLGTAHWIQENPFHFLDKGGRILSAELR